MAEIPLLVLGDKLVAPPTDGISALKFSQDSDLLVAASWDRTVRVYDAALNQARGVIEHQSPVLSVCLKDDVTGFSGSLDGQVKWWVITMCHKRILYITILVYLQ